MDLKGLPESDFKKLAQLLGDEKAYAYLVKRRFNYQAVVMKILKLKTKAYLKRKPIYYAVIFILLVISFIILMFPDLFFF